jgi:molybdopterin converting factor small subunit
MMEGMKVPHIVTVEFYGVPRQRAGRAELPVAAGTVAEVLHAVERECPEMKGLMTAAGCLSAQYLVSVDGEEFVTDFQRTLASGSRVLVLSADAGG